MLGDYAPKYELIIFCSNGSKKLNGGRSSNVIKCAKMTTDNHPTEKPTNLLRHLIEKSTNKGDLVLDTFAGSFSTARACKEIGRDFICFEVGPNITTFYNRKIHHDIGSCHRSNSFSCSHQINITIKQFSKRFIQK